MATSFNGTDNGQSYNLTSDYQVVYAGATTYKVNVTLIQGGYGAEYTAWVSKNGTAIAVYYNGQNYTGIYAQTFFYAAMSPYSIERSFTTPQLLAALTSPLFSRQTGQATLMIGPTSVMVTNYAASSLPLSIDECGFTGQFTRFALQTGVVSGEPTTLITSLSLKGSFTTNGSSQSVDFNFRITSLTKSV